MANKFDLLFEPVPIGPVVAPNRFYQVPHCNGMGYRMPRALAAMRGIKAEGGWGVVCTEEVEIHPTSDLAPNIEGRLWADADIPALELMAEAVHRHGALGGIELTYSGRHAANFFSRVPGLGPRSMGVSGFHPGQTLQVIGDAEAPHIISQAVFSGHLAARTFGEPTQDETPFRIERIRIG